MLRGKQLDAVHALLDFSMEGLKDFQKATVKTVMESFNGGAESNRVLVADEVGLGKTIVAKGVIATSLKRHLVDNSDKGKRRPYRVTYICSNLALADENREKLSVFDSSVRNQYISEPSFTRLLEVARDEKEKDKGKILEICTLTPSTSFNLTRGDGNVVERVIIYMALCKHAMLAKHSMKLRRSMQGDVSDSTWVRTVSEFDEFYILNKMVIKRFHKWIKTESPHKNDDCSWLGIPGESTYLEILLSLCGMNANNGLLEENRIFIYRFRAKLRGLMARCCASNLTADLFILDEFQRFKALLGSDVESDHSLIAREVFKNESGAKILLLSATPFKAMTRVVDDEAGEAHADDLLFLLKFLMDSDVSKLERYESGRKRILEQLLSLRDCNNKIEDIDSSAKQLVESVLSPYILRTERGQISKGYDAVYDLEGVLECIDTFGPLDIKSFVAVSAIEEGLNKIHKGRYSGQVMEFCKSSPWPMSFLNGYQLFERIKHNRRKKEIVAALGKSGDAWLRKRAIDRYHLSLAMDAPNARVRALVDIVFGNGGEALLWMPPTLTYYEPNGPYKGSDGFTKSLLFSAWAMVPRALSGLLSYESERRNLSNKSGRKKGYFQPERNPIIRFEGDAGMDGWSLVYPSLTLSAIPLTPGGNTVQKEKSLIIEKMSAYLPLLEKYTAGTERRSFWYAFAPILLDIERGHYEYVRSWVDSQSVTKRSGADASGRRKHLQLLERVFDGDTLELGPMPSDLLDFLCELALAGPGVCSVRAWRNKWDVKLDQIAIDAGRVGMAITHMFNKIDSISILEKYYTKVRHWRAALKYCLAGNLQAVIDEYTHLLADSGMTSQVASERYAQVCGITTSSVSCQYWNDKNRFNKTDENKDPYKLRCHYAVPLGTQRVTDDSGLERVVSVRDAFNSPFRPFVLNSTSIGQEGLDFHWYSSRVIHWNLPSNPIDIEQREGRVNRYKSLVVRRRIAEIYASQLSKEHVGDIWKNLFELGDQMTKDSRISDIEPYWHLSEGTAKIERIVPMMPMSREVKRLQEALKVLSLYRLAFGQPRQEELLNNLLHRKLTEEELTHLREKLVINLAPHMRLIEKGDGH